MLCSNSTAKVNSRIHQHQSKLCARRWNNFVVVVVKGEWGGRGGGRRRTSRDIKRNESILPSDVLWVNSLQVNETAGPSLHEHHCIWPSSLSAFSQFATLCSFLSAAGVPKTYFVATKLCLSTNICCDKHSFEFCLGKHTLVATKDVFCRDKDVFVAKNWYLWQLPPMIVFGQLE